MSSSPTSGNRIVVSLGVIVLLTLEIVRRKDVSFLLATPCVLFLSVEYLPPNKEFQLIGC